MCVWLLISADDCCDFLLISWQSNASLEDTLSVIVTQCDIACHCCDTSATSQHQKSMSRLSLHPSLWHQYLLSFPDHGDHFFWKMSLCRKVVLLCVIVVTLARHPTRSRCLVYHCILPSDNNICCPFLIMGTTSSRKILFAERWYCCVSLLWH